MRHQLLAMRCVPRCGLLSQFSGAIPCTAPALWPERLSAVCSWSPWRSKWNHMGEPDSSIWPEEKLTWAEQQTVADEWSLPPGLTLTHTQCHHTMSSRSHTRKYVSLQTCLDTHFLSLALMYTPHPSYTLSGVSAAAVPSGVADR